MLEECIAEKFGAIDILTDRNFRHLTGRCAETARIMSKGGDKVQVILPKTVHLLQ